MELKEAVWGRRSMRAYDERPLTGEILKELIALGVYAPSGTNFQPWAFVVIEDKEFMQKWSDQSKKLLLSTMNGKPYLEQYRRTLERKQFNIFYNAPCLLLIYGNTDSLSYIYDCSMVAQNIMLAAYEKGLGSCWIGFATAYGNTVEIKERLGVPEKYKLVAPLILGYPSKTKPRMARKEPLIFSWHR